MGLNSPPHICMETPDWRQICQGAIDDDPITGSCSPSEEIISCSRPMIERRVRPQQEQALQCPRCDSTHTKFCYYNNYSLSQPRYFCKSCRRYWTKGGSLRNVPVGGGCRKNKKPATKKSSADPTSSGQHQLYLPHEASGPGSGLAFREMMQFPHLNSLLSMPERPNLESQMHFDFMNDNNCLNAELGRSRGPYGFLGCSEMGHLSGDVNLQFSSGIQVPSSSYGFSMDGTNQGPYIDIGEKMLLPFEGGENPNAGDIKPRNKFLSLEWQDHEGCSDVGRDPIGHLMNGIGSWTGAEMNSFGPSSTNHMV